MDLRKFCPCIVITSMEDTLIYQTPTSCPHVVTTTLSSLFSLFPTSLTPPLTLSPFTSSVSSLLCHPESKWTLCIGRGKASVNHWSPLCMHWLEKSIQATSLMLIRCCGYWCRGDGASFTREKSAADRKKHLNYWVWQGENNVNMSQNIAGGHIWSWCCNKC